MAISPRKDEVAAVVDVLSSDAYDSADAMAKGIIKLVSQLLAARDSFGVAAKLRTDGPEYVLALGPYWAKGDAEKALENAAESGLVGHVAPLHSTTTLDHVADLTHGDVRCTCEHRKELHIGGKTGCAVYRCPCGVFDPA